MDLDRAVILNKTNGEKLECEPLPAHLVAMVRDGGLLAHLEKRLK
jgi:3-isopropylmalate/(R)-2-methylmalate dehydratase small subunit